MRRGTLPALSRWLLCAAAALAGCADDDPNALDPLPPTAASELGLPEPRPRTEQPLVLLIVDSSGSMERRLGCSCVTPGCAECLPDCAAGERSRYLDVLETLTGSFQGYACSAEPRPRDGDGSYDRDYGLPHVQLGESTRQAADGLLDRLGGHVRFGVATLDSVRSYGAESLVGLSSFDWQRSKGPAGMYSYAGASAARPTRPRLRPDGSTVGKLFFPGASEPYLIDTGLRSPAASEGALLLPGLDDAPAELRTSIARQLRAVRPYGGSPLSAALDDAYFALTQLGPRQAAPHSYVVLLSDGPADDDFRQLPSPGCACASEAECGESPAAMSCPYPLPDAAAAHLRCGFSDAACDGPVDAVYVLGLGPTDGAERQALDGIAAAGGSDSARIALDAGELRARLDEITLALLRDSR